MRRRGGEGEEKQPEPHWHACCSVLAYCQGGDAVAHELSKNDGRYDFEKTQDKLDRARDANGPPGCGHFHKLNPEICARCDHKGKITTPVELGRRAYANGEDADGRAGQEGGETAAGQGVDVRGTGDERIPVKLKTGEIGRIADEVEAILVKRGVELFVREWDRAPTLVSTRKEQT
jgi:hypothetical protein